MILLYSCWLWKIFQPKDDIESHYDGAKAARLDTGCYWYSYATNVDDAKEKLKPVLRL